MTLLVTKIIEVFLHTKQFSATPVECPAIQFSSKLSTQR